MANKKKEIRLESTTVVLPCEYNAGLFVESLKIISNADHSYIVSCDVGKVIGLYESAKALSHALANAFDGIDLEFQDECNDALATFFRFSVK